MRIQTIVLPHKKVSNVVIEADLVIQISATPQESIDSCQKMEIETNLGDNGVLTNGK